MRGSRGETGGPEPLPPPTEKSQKGVYKQYWFREKSQSYQASIKCLAIIGI